MSTNVSTSIKKELRLNTLLAKTEYSAAQFKKLVTDYIAFFKGKQGEFKGIRKTYAPRENVVDEPSMRGITKVVTTVEEKLVWLEETAGEHIDNLFSVESTNASGVARASLVVEGVDFGSLSSLELLRLKSLLESGDFESMYANIPVRDDSSEWELTREEMYEGKEVYEGIRLSGIKKSIVKRPRILKDPNIDPTKENSRYAPQVVTDDEILELGDYTIQHFSGEATHRERAEILRRRSKLLSAVIEALKVANEAVAKESSLTSKKLFGYLHKGKI